MRSLGLFVVLLAVSVRVSAGRGSVRVSAGPGCGSCDPARCPPPPAAGCPAGSVRDSCGCCSVCAAAEGDPCGARRTRCGPGLECARRDQNQDQDQNQDRNRKVGVCRCKSEHEVCGSDGTTYRTGCALKTASRTRTETGLEPLTVRNKGRCASAPVIVSAPLVVSNVTGSQVYLSCEVVGVPTPSLTWRKVLSGKRRVELLPGDRDNLAVQTRGGPEKHQVTGWVLVSPLTTEEEGVYECHASNSRGEASAVGSIHVVASVDDIIKKVTKEEQQEEEL